MKTLFGLFVRLFGAFLAAKLVLTFSGGETAGNLIGLSLFFVFLTYLCCLERYLPEAWRRVMAEKGWRLSRKFIGWNALKPEE
jgi:hypothetical protein